MRFLFLTDFYPPHIGGQERFVKISASELARRGHDVAVATIKHAGRPEPRCEEGVRVYPVDGIAQQLTWLYRDDRRRFHLTMPDPRIAHQLRKIVQQENPQVVSANSWVLFSFLPIKFLSSAKLTLMHHDYGFFCPKRTLMRAGGVCNDPGSGKCFSCSREQYGFLKGMGITAGLKFSSRWYSRIDRHFANSEFMATAVRTGLNPPPSRIDVIHPPLPAEVINFQPLKIPEADIPKEGGFILFVGALTRHKGVNVLLEAYRGLEGRAKLVLIGAEWPDSPKSFPPGVIVIKNAPHHVVMDAWSRCLFGVVPSIWPEPFGLVAAEAMAMRRPVIATAHGGITDVVIDGQTGLLVKPNDVHSLHCAMVRLLDDGNLRERLGHAGRELVQSQLTIPKFMLKLESIYYDLVGLDALGGDKWELHSCELKGL